MKRNATKTRLVPKNWLGCLFCCALLFPNCLTASQAVKSWVQNHSINSSTSPAGFTVGTNGTVYVTGPALHTTETFYHYLTIAYSNEGVPVWTNRFHGPSNYGDYPAAIASSGTNVYVTGASVENGPGETYATIAYSANGSPLWTNRYNGTNFSAARAIAVDQGGNVYVTGGSWEIDIDYATVAYAPNGTALWTNRYNGAGDNWDEARAITVDQSSNVFITGFSSSGNGFDGFDFATIAYSKMGVPLWTNRYDGPDNNEDRAVAIAVDAHHVYVTGNSRSSVGGNLTCATVAYSIAGVPLWTNRYNELSSTSMARDVAVNNEGIVVVAGSITSQGAQDVFTVAYSSGGTPLWTNRYDGPEGNLDEASGVVVDNCGNVYVAGSASGVGAFDDFLLLAYSSTGAALWTNYYSTEGSDLVQAIALDANGHVYLTGWSPGNGSPWVTIKYGVSPNITSHPTTQTNLVRTIATFGVSACGTRSLHYQWQKDDTNLIDDGRISGSQTPTLTITNLALADAGSYRVVITNLAGGESSSPAFLGVFAPQPKFVSTTLHEGVLHLLLQGLTNVTYSLETSTDMSQWSSVTNLTSPNGVMSYVDSNITNSPTRFYRAMWTP